MSNKPSNDAIAQPAPATISPAASAVEKAAQALKQEDVGRETLWQAAYMLRNYATELRTSSEPTPDVIRDAALCSGYAGGMLVSDNEKHVIHLHYESRKQVEAAYECLTGRIDAAIREQQRSEGKDNER